MVGHPSARAGLQRMAGAVLNARSTPRPERVAERFVRAWQSGDRASLAALATPALVKQVLDDASLRFPEDTPAEDGPLLHLSGAEDGDAGRLTLHGEVRWGAQLRPLALELTRDGARLRSAHFTQPAPR